MENLKKFLTFFMVLLGLVSTIKLAMIYYDANFNPYALSSFCSVNDFIDCDGIAKTVDSQFLGIPLAYWGICLYLFILLMLFVDKLKGFKYLKFLEVFKNPYAYISAISLLSFSVGIILAVVSVFYIKKVCVLCFMTYFINLLLVFLTNNEKNILNNFRISFYDFIEALSIKKYLITFILLMLLASCFLAYTRITYIFAPQVKIIKSIEYFLNLKTNPYKVSGNVLGNKNGDVIIEVYSDFVCPLCYANDIMIHKAAKEFKNIKIIPHNMPLDKECNDYINIQVHPNACLLSRYALAAQKQGKYWDLSAELFENRPKNEDEIVKLAERLDLNIEKLKSDANSKEISKILELEIKTAVKTGIEGTPAIVINGEKYIGIKPYFKLAEIFKNAGAIKR